MRNHQNSQSTRYLRLRYCGVEEELYWQSRHHLLFNTKRSDAEAERRRNCIDNLSITCCSIQNAQMPKRGGGGIVLTIPPSPAVQYTPLGCWSGAAGELYWQSLHHFFFNTSYTACILQSPGTYIICGIVTDWKQLFTATGAKKACISMETTLESHMPTHKSVTKPHKSKHKNPQTGRIILNGYWRLCCFFL